MIRFTLNSNRYPINKIKILDSNKNFKNYFITYDTTGYDWTVRLWDLNKGDSLISSFTCPSRIVSCNLNTAPLFFEHKTRNDNDLFICVALYGKQDLLIIKIISNQAKKTTSHYQITSEKNSTLTDIFSNDEFLHKEINL